MEFLSALSSWRDLFILGSVVDGIEVDYIKLLQPIKLVCDRLM